jgi:purine-binding chemotaxis protein CheW
VERNDGAARRDTASAEVCQLVIFTIAGEAFALPIDRVESIIKPQAITVVPHARPYVVGVTNLRGTVLPVIDLRRRFHLPSAEESEEQRIVVVLFNEEKIGIQVDAVSQVLRIPLSAIEPPPPLVTAFVHSAFVTGIAKVDERLVILLDLEKILLPNHEN